MSNESIHSAIRRSRSLACSLLILLAPLASAQLDFSVSPSPVGSGARAAGMADAFVSIADDATAASWNPAGLVQLELPELSIVGEFHSLSESFNADNFSFDPMFESDHSASNTDLNFLSFVYPAYIFNRNVVFSMSYQQRYDFGRDFRTNFNTQNDVSTQILEGSFDQEGSFSVLTPSVAFPVTDSLSLGISVNLWRSSVFADNDWEVTEGFNIDSFQDGVLVREIQQVQTESYDDFRGENFVIGALWNVNDRWNIGLRFDTAFKGKVDYGRTISRLDTALAEPFFSEISEDRKIKFPWTVAFGASYRRNDRLTLSMDISITDWDKAYVQDESGEKFSLIDGLSFDSSAHTDLDPTKTVRLGAEYVFIPKTRGEKLNTLWSLRGGLFYDQEPATGRPSAGAAAFEPGDGNPDDFYGIATGVGLLVKQRVNIDVAYQFRYGHDVNTDFVRGVPGFDEDVTQHRVVFSTVIYF